MVLRWEQEGLAGVATESAEERAKRGGAGVKVEKVVVVEAEMAAAAM